MKYFDLHCDTLTELKGKSLADNVELHISLDRAPEKYIQCFAIFVSDRLRGDEAYEFYRAHKEIFDLQTQKTELIAVRDAESLLLADKSGKGGILTVESGAALGGRLSRIEKLALDGVRMLTLTWNGGNELGFGSGEGGGLTDFGKDALKELERCRILADVSHLSDDGFSELCEVSSSPFIASHSNCSAVHPHRRNLKDWQIKEIVNRGGLIGVNVYSEFISGKHASVAELAEHIFHLEKLGAGDCICFGSDFDGMNSMPPGITGIESVGFLRKELAEAGITEEALDKYFYENAFNFFNKFWRLQK